MKVRRSAKGLIKVSSGDLLFVAGKSGRWSLPGGEIETGESEKRAFLREVFEETKVKPNQLADVTEVATITGNRANTSHVRSVAEWTLFTAGLVTPFEEIPKPNGCEITDIGTLSIAACLAMPNVTGLAKQAVRTVCLAA